MKIRIESARCKGHQNCTRIAPALFSFGPDGSAQIVADGSVPRHLQEQALLASDNCPEFAIEIDEEENDGNAGTADRHA